MGQNVQEVNEMWERDKVAGWWKGRQAAGGDDRTEGGNYTGEGGRQSRGYGEETKRVATYGDTDTGAGGAAVTKGRDEGGGCVDGEVGVEAGAEAQ